MVCYTLLQLHRSSSQNQIQCCLDISQQKQHHIHTCSRHHKVGLDIDNSRQMFHCTKVGRHLGCNQLEGQSGVHSVLCKGIYDCSIQRPQDTSRSQQLFRFCKLHNRERSSSLTMAGTRHLTLDMTENEFFFFKIVDFYLSKVDCEYQIVDISSCISFNMHIKFCFIHLEALKNQCFTIWLLERVVLHFWKCNLKVLFFRCH